MIFQERAGAKAPVPGHFVLKGERSVRFAVGDYDPARPLVIDPVLSYSTYFGGSMTEYASAIAVDSDGNIVIAGATNSANLPTVNPLAAAGGVFVAKFNPDGASLLFSTYLLSNVGPLTNSTDGEHMPRIAVDQSGNILVTGMCGRGFPTTAGAIQAEFDRGHPKAIGSDVFMVKLTPLGNSLVYSTYLGGDHSDEPRGIAVDASGNAYVTGITRSINFLTSGNALSTSIHGPVIPDEFDDSRPSLGYSDAFVTSLSPTGALRYSTYLGGSYFDYGTGIAVDADGVAHVVGSAGSDDFPITADAFQRELRPPQDAFYVKLDSSGGSLLYATFLGGNAGLEVSPTTLAFNSPSRFDAEDRESVLLLRNPSSKQITVTRFNFGEGADNFEFVEAVPFSLAPGEERLVKVRCFSCIRGISNWYSISATVDGLDPHPSDLSNNNRLRVVGFLKGGSASDRDVAQPASAGLSDGDLANAVAVDTAGNAYIAGTAQSFDFPVQGMPRPAQDNLFPRFGKAFAAKFNSASQLQYSNFFGGAFHESARGIVADDAGNAYIVGITTSGDFPTVDPFQAAPGGPVHEFGSDGDAFVTKLSPSGATLFSTYLGGDRYEMANAIALDRNTNIYVSGGTGSTNFPTVSPLQPALGNPPEEEFFSGTDAFVAMISQGQASREVELWQKLEIPAPTGNDGPASFKVEFVRMINGLETRVEAEILEVRPGFVTVRVPPGLLGPADVSAPPLGVDNNVRIEILRASNRQEIARQGLILRMPQPIIVDEVDVRRGPPPSPGLRTLSQFVFNTGSPNIHTFAFLGRSTDGLMGLRVLNSELRFPAPLLFDAEDVVVFEPGGGSAPLQRIGAPFHIPNLGPGNQGVQFNVSRNGLYVIAIEPNAGSPGPFPARYQFHLTGNVGLPRKLVNEVAEAPRGTRLDTLFNHSAPRPQSLLSVTGAEARTAMFKFTNVASISPFARAVLLPPAGGFASGTRIVRAADPIAPLELTTPTARTPDCEAPVIGTVIDFTQIPDPASVAVPGAAPLSESVCAVIGENDGHAVTLPKTLAGGGGVVGSLILDMGSGHEIVDGAGADFEVLASAGSYKVQVGNTPFAGSFSEALGPFTAVQQIDLAAAGLTSARYVWITPSPNVVLDAVRGLNLFADEVSATIGPITHVTSATITARRVKVAANKLDPFLQLIAPNGDLFAENEAGFGDDLTQDLSDAALVNRILPQDGFYRYLVKGFDKQPDEQSMGAFLTRLETAGAYDPVELVVGNLGEAQTPAQKTGNFSTSRQRDSYLFQAAPGQTVNIVVNATGDGPKVNPVVELYDPEDFLIAANDDFRDRELNAARTATLPAQGLAVGTYRIVVSAVDGFGTASGFNGGTAHIRQAATGGYELKVFTGTMIQPEGAPRIVSLQPAQGAPGATVVIAGADFGDTPGANPVRFGAVQAVVASATATRLEVTVPAGLAAGRADVTVTVG
ncbi:MAG TPA: SBBP repeat-containing protein, partial [Verrucomicrobiales bacterium]|nr:SBBP repeat-containing protein [Verrucomicrobiales bacterium]